MEKKIRNNEIFLKNFKNTPNFLITYLRSDSVDGFNYIKYSSLFFFPLFSLNILALF